MGKYSEGGGGVGGVGSEISICGVPLTERTVECVLNFN